MSRYCEGAAWKVYFSSRYRLMLSLRLKAARMESFQEDQRQVLKWLS